jgi:hypothetical protein
MRAYKNELGDLYRGALRRRNYRDAKKLYDRRRQINRWILVYEEWHPD